MEITVILSSIDSIITMKNELDTSINEQESFGGKSSEQLLLEQEAVLSSEEVYSGGRAGRIQTNAQEDELWSPKIKISDKDKVEAEKNEDTGIDDLTLRHH
eukprot:15252894-Ditylum_brightwellii.AAC.1